MIIGISGKIGSGKDTVGKIIQYLTHCKDDGTTFEEWNTLKHYDMCSWKIHKFADALKDIVCILTGCTREQLEDEEFKNSKLPSEWEYWYNYHYKLITNDTKGILGKRYGSQFEVEREHDVLSNNINGHFFKCDTYTYRELLQYLGTDLLRNQLHENVWVNALFNKYKDEWNGMNTYNNTCKFPNWVITDCRFENEAKAIKDRGGIVIRVNRNDYIFDNKGKRIISSKSYINIDTVQHSSETALDDYDFDYVINNDTTFDTLISNVHSILVKENII